MKPKTSKSKIKWKHTREPNESIWDYWTRIKTPIGVIMVLIALDKIHNKQYNQTVSVWIGDDIDEPSYVKEDVVDGDIERTIKEIGSLQNNVLVQVTYLLLDSARAIVDKAKP